METRKNFIEFLLKIPEFKEINIGILAKCLQADGFHRMGGVESQGSRVTYHDYQPRIKEIFDYWQFSLTKLIEFLNSDPANNKQIKEIIIRSFRGISYHRGLEIILDTLKKMLGILPDSKIEIYREIKTVIAYGTKIDIQ